jgi:outer membrane lipoprotein-sorting protein
MFRLLLISALLFAPSAAETLESVLSRMDAAAAAFRSLTAHVRSVKHTEIVNDNSIDEGTIWVKRNKGRARLLIEFTVPDRYYVEIQDGKAAIYRPKIATLEEYDTARYRNLKDQLWLLSFGTAGHELAAHYRVSLKGTEPAAGQQCVKLELIPKSPDLLEHIPKIEMWVSSADWIPVQLKIYDVTPGDYRLSTYTNIRLNANFPDSQLRIHPAAGTRKIHPQK